MEKKVSKTIGWSLLSVVVWSTLFATVVLQVHEQIP